MTPQLGETSAAKFQRDTLRRSLLDLSLLVGTKHRLSCQFGSLNVWWLLTSNFHLHDLRIRISHLSLIIALS